MADDTESTIRTTAADGVNHGEVTSQSSAAADQTAEEASCQVSASHASRTTHGTTTEEASTRTPDGPSLLSLAADQETTVCQETQVPRPARFRYVSYEFNWSVFKNWLASDRTSDPYWMYMITCYIDDRLTKPATSKKDSSLSHSILIRLCDLENSCRIANYFYDAPSIIDFLSTFARDTSNIRAPSSFRSRLRLSAEASGLEKPRVAHSGKDYHVAYSLKQARRILISQEPHCHCLGHQVPKYDWTTEEAIAYHSFDTRVGSMVHLLVSGDEKLRARAEKVFGQGGAWRSARTEPTMWALGEDAKGQSVNEKDWPSDDPSDNVSTTFQSSLDMHRLMARDACEGWRGYVRWLEDTVECKTKSALEDETNETEFFAVSEMQALEDRLVEVQRHLESNGKVLHALDDFYQDLMTNQDFELRHQSECHASVAKFCYGLHDLIYETEGLHREASVVWGTMKGRRKLIMAQRATKMTVKQRQEAILLRKEAKLLKIIAVLTAIFLPASFISSFFSTDVVKYQQQGGGGASSSGSSDGDGSSEQDPTSFSPMALNRWLQLALPLTGLVFMIAAGWYYDVRPYRWSVRWIRRHWRWRHQPEMVDDVEKQA